VDGGAGGDGAVDAGGLWAVASGTATEGIAQQQFECGADMQDIDTISEHKVDTPYVRGVRLFNHRTQADLDALAELWKRQGFLLVRSALTPEAVDLLTREVTFHKRLSVHDVRQFYRAHNDDECNGLLREVLEAANGFYSVLLRASLASEYAFAMHYIKNSDMDPHYDNYNNNISSTICYHATPEDLKNPIFVDKAKFSNPYTMRVTVKDRDGIPGQNVVELDLKPGDMAVFRGRNHLHWRNFVSDDMDYRAVLLHYSDYMYKGKMIRSRPMQHIANELIDVESYDAFREEHAMYFETSDQGWI